MATIAPRVNELEKTVSGHATKIYEHDLILNGTKDCPGLAKDVEDMKSAIININLLLNSQRLYNKILVFFASAIAVSVVGYIMKLIFG